MSTLTLIHALGSVGLFASRAFLSAFVVALLLRYGPQVEVLRHGVLARIDGTPSWFTSDLALIVLGILAALEMVSTKVAEVRDAMREVEPAVKSGVAVAATFGIIGTADAAFVTGVMHAGAADYVALLPVAAGTFFFARVRSALLAPLHDADPDDSAGIAGFLSWAEDFGVIVGAVLLLLYPVFMAAGLAAILAVLTYFQRRAHRRELAQRVPCTGCGALMLPCAVACGACHLPAEAPRAVGFFGTASTEPATDRRILALELAAHHRCAACAHPLGRSGGTLPSCAHCGLQAFFDPAFAAEFDAHLRWRAARTLGLAALLSAVPVIGFIPAVVVCRMRLVKPYSPYVSGPRRFAYRWGLRVLLLAMMAVQVIPFVGVVAVPLHGFTSWRLYRSDFMRVRENALAQRLAPSPAAALPPAA